MKKIKALLYIIIQIIFLSQIVYPQSPAIKQALEEYEKNMYPWKPPEYEQTNNDSILTVLGRWAWGPCHAVDVKGNYAYIGNGPTFHILDISDPAQPEIVGEFITEGYVYDIKMRENIAFICIGSGLLILDVTNPSLPQELSFIVISGIAGKLAIDGSFAYVLTGSRSMRVVDITDLSNPVLRGILIMQHDGASISAKDGYIFIGNYGLPSFQIVNAQNPDSLTYTYFYNGKLSTSLFIRDSLLFIGGKWFSTHFMIYDISDLTLPQFIAQVEIPDNVFIEGIALSEDGLTTYALTLGEFDPLYNSNVYSIDITNVNQPIISNKFQRNTAASAWGISVSQNNLIAASFMGCYLIDTTNPDSLILNSFFPTGGFAQRISIKDSYAFVASGYSGLWILDISEPSKPKSIKNINTGGNTSDVIVDDTLVYIMNSPGLGSKRGLWIATIADIDNPVILSNYIGIVSSSPTGVPNSVFKSGNKIFITQARTSISNNILEIIDVSNPYKPINLGTYQGNYRAHRVAIKDTIVFLATSDGGLRIININNPHKPVEVNVFNDSSFLVGIFIKDSIAFADRIDTLFVLDISYPIQPVILGRMGRSTGSFSRIDLYAVNNYLYWAEGILGVIDISNYESPTQVATFPFMDAGRGVSAIENMIFFSDRSVGIWVLRNNLITDIKEPYEEIPENFYLYQNYPNPFNPETIIEFYVPQRANVKIEVFNMLGQKLKTLFDQEVESGKQIIKYRAVGLSSGVYFYRMKTSEKTITKKMILLR